MFNLNKNTIINSGIDQNFLTKIISQIDETNINNGKILSNINLLFKKEKIIHNIHEAEFKIFSQWGDDGIIDFLCNYLDVANKTFIEFGVENYKECNTRFLLVKDNWSGLIIDGSEENISSVKSENLYWRHNLIAISKFVTTENINQIFTENNFTGEIGLLHIDIDGNDYWIWDCINVVSPVIVIVEYNSLFGNDNPWTTMYDPAYRRTDAHFSNLLYGTSLLSLNDLAEKKGYSFIGCNSNGNNAYFVRKDKIKDIQVKSVEEGYVLSQFSEGRDENGHLTFVRNEKRQEVLKGATVFNTRSGKSELIG